MGEEQFRFMLNQYEVNLNIDYKGQTEIFMHPVPRGVPILETAPDVTVEINRARNYLTKCLEEI